MYTHSLSLFVITVLYLDRYILYSVDGKQQECCELENSPSYE